MNNIRQTLNQDINTLLKEFLEKHLDEDANEEYTGIVVDNNDPDKLGRCRIRVYGIFGDEIPDKDLPWAIQDSFFIGSELGSFITPPNGALVKVYFDGGDIYLPHYTTKAFNRNKLPSDKNTDYPDNLIFFELDDGDKLTLNRRTGDLKFEHRTGTKFNIKKTTGEVIVEHKSGSTITMDGSGSIKFHHVLFLEDDGSAVVPSGIGPFNTLPVDPVTGITHSGQRVLPGV